MKKVISTERIVVDNEYFNESFEPTKKDKNIFVYVGAVKSKKYKIIGKKKLPFVGSTFITNIVLERVL